MKTSSPLPVRHETLDEFVEFLDDTAGPHSSRAEAEVIDRSRRGNTKYRISQTHRELEPNGACAAEFEMEYVIVIEKGGSGKILHIEQVLDW